MDVLQSMSLIGSATEVLPAGNVSRLGIRRANRTQIEVQLFASSWRILLLVAGRREAAVRIRLAPGV
jgi:hypothetical protein